MKPTAGTAAPARATVRPKRSPSAFPICCLEDCAPSFEEYGNLNLIKKIGSSPNYSERQKKADKKRAFLRNSPSFFKGGRGGISDFPFVCIVMIVLVLSTCLSRSL